jgi:hypothetical protein
MSVIKNSNYGWFISHETLINEIYSSVNSSATSFQLKPDLFEIVQPYKPAKSKHNLKRKTNDEDFGAEVRCVEKLYELFRNENKEIFAESRLEVRNDAAVTAAARIYDESGNNLIGDVVGANPDGPIVKRIKNSDFLFPQNCKFYGKDVADMSTHLDEKYDLIVLDPPWWNKYIRRKRKHTEHGYDMMYNEELRNLPLENYLSKEGLVAVWCTNSGQHVRTLCDEIFPKWGLEYVGKWYWVKVTKSGVPVCPFSEPPRKQPFEQIIFGRVQSRSLADPACDKLVVSVPSALHSHKPPLIRKPRVNIIAFD